MNHSQTLKKIKDVYEKITIESNILKQCMDPTENANVGISINQIINLITNLYEQSGANNVELDAEEEEQEQIDYKRFKKFKAIDRASHCADVGDTDYQLLIQEAEEEAKEEEEEDNDLIVDTNNVIVIAESTSSHNSRKRKRHIDDEQTEDTSTKRMRLDDRYFVCSVLVHCLLICPLDYAVIVVVMHQSNKKR